MKYLGKGLCLLAWPHGDDITPWSNTLYATENQKIPMSYTRTSSQRPNLPPNRATVSWNRQTPATVGSPQLPFPLLSRHSPSGTRQGCLLLSPTLMLPGGRPMQSRVWPEKPTPPSGEGTAVLWGHFICYLNHFHFLQIMKARGLYVFTEMDYHVIRVYSIKIRKYRNPANFHHPRRGRTSLLGSVSCVRPHGNTCFV